MNRKLFESIGVLLIAGVLCACSATGPHTAPASGSTAADYNPAAAEATRNVGEAYLNEGNLIAALREFKRAEALNPDDPITHYDLGLVYYYRERYDQAVEHLERAIRLRPDYAPAINSLGNVYAAQQKWDKAIEAYERIVDDAFYGTPYFPLSNMGLAYYHKKDYAKAEKYLLEALKLSPDFINALGGLGATYNALGRYAEAAAKLERAVKKDPKSAPLHFELARAYAGMGEKQKARIGYSRVVELAPGSPLAVDAQRELKLLNP